MERKETAAERPHAFSRGLKATVRTKENRRVSGRPHLAVALRPWLGITEICRMSGS